MNNCDHSCNCGKTLWTSIVKYIENVLILSKSNKTNLLSQLLHAHHGTAQNISHTRKVLLLSARLRTVLGAVEQHGQSLLEHHEHRICR